VGKTLKSWLPVAVACAITVLCAQLGFADLFQDAQNDEFGKKLMKLMTWVQMLGIVIAIGGGVFVGIKFVSGDENASKHLKNLIIGLVVIIGLPTIIKIISGFIGGN
jgi:uncharacterized membrane protein